MGVVLMLAQASHASGRQSSSESGYLGGNESSSSIASLESVSYDGYESQPSGSSSPEESYEALRLHLRPHTPRPSKDQLADHFWDSPSPGGNQPPKKPTAAERLNQRLWDFEYSDEY